jgi:hypothetical protein
MAEGEQVQAALTRAAQAREEMRGVEQRLAGAARHADATEARVAELRRLLAREDEDVDRLESFSPTRIWAALKGSRATDLDRETAERDAARYAVAEAEARRDVATRECAALQERLRTFGDVEAGYTRALADKDRWVRENDSGTSAVLAELAERRGRLLAQDKEAREAHSAGLRRGPISGRRSGSSEAPAPGRRGTRSAAGGC